MPTTAPATRPPGELLTADDLRAETDAAFAAYEDALTEHQRAGVAYRETNRRTAAAWVTYRAATAAELAALHPDRAEDGTR